MIAHLTQLLSHYANRVVVTMQPHPKGAQMTISVMPCPNKVKDEALRQQLIQPIVLVGDDASLTEQLRGVGEALATARENETLNNSVNNYLESLTKASAKPTAKPAAKVDKVAASKPDNAQTPPTVPTPSPAASALDDMFI